MDDRVSHEENYLDNLATRIADGRLAPLAIFILESLKPFASLIHTSAVLEGPPLTHLAASNPWTSSARFLTQHPEKIEAFILAIEQKTKAREPK